MDREGQRVEDPQRKAQGIVTGAQVRRGGRHLDLDSHTHLSSSPRARAALTACRNGDPLRFDVGTVGGVQGPGGIFESVTAESTWAKRLRLISDEPLTDELTGFTTKSLQGISLSAAIAGVVILVTYPIYLGSLATGEQAAQDVANEMQGPVLTWRLILLAAVVILTGVFAFMRARTADKPNRALAWIIGIAFVLAVASELLGRGLHYEGLWHVGLNTTQYLLGQ